MQGIRGAPEPKRHSPTDAPRHAEGAAGGPADSGSAEAAAPTGWRLGARRPVRLSGGAAPSTSAAPTVVQPRPSEPSLGDGVVSLTSTAAQRPVFLTPSGALSLTADGDAPENLKDVGETFFRAAEAISEAPSSPLASATPEARRRLLHEIQQTLAKVPAGAAPPAELTADQANQLRASAWTLLLDLVDQTDGELRDQVLTQYQALAEKETSPRLRDAMISQLGRTDAAQKKGFFASLWGSDPGPVRKLADALSSKFSEQLPYDRWFANGNRTLNIAFFVGDPQMAKGAVQNFVWQGYRRVGADAQGNEVYEKTLKEEGVGETTFRLTLKSGSLDLKTLSDPNFQVVGSMGHSEFGRAMMRALEDGPTDPATGEGKVLFNDLCSGKMALDRVRDRFPSLQMVTTVGASGFEIDQEGVLTRSEGLNALDAMVTGIARRDDWKSMQSAMNRVGSMKNRNWDNYLTPGARSARALVLDGDYDGQADYLDKLFEFSTYRPQTDTLREFAPQKPTQPEGKLEGTKVMVAAGVVNMATELSGFLSEANPNSAVVARGWYQAQSATDPLVKFTKQKSRDGSEQIVMRVDSRYAHMSEEALRAVSMYEFSRQANLGLDPVDAKLAGLLATAMVISTDSSPRDEEVWSALLTRYGFPAGLPFQAFKDALLRHQSNNYAGDSAALKDLKQRLAPALVESLRRPQAGVAVPLLPT